MTHEEVEEFAKAMHESRLEPGVVNLLTVAPWEAISPLARDSLRCRARHLLRRFDIKPKQPTPVTLTVRSEADIDRVAGTIYGRLGP